MKFIDLLQAIDNETRLHVLIDKKTYYQGFKKDIKIHSSDMIVLQLDVLKLLTHSYLWSTVSTVIINLYKKNKS